MKVEWISFIGKGHPGPTIFFLPTPLYLVFPELLTIIMKKGEGRAVKYLMHDVNVNMQKGYFSKAIMLSVLTFLLRCVNTFVFPIQNS